MEINVIHGDLTNASGNTLVVNCFEDGELLGKEAIPVDQALDSLISRLNKQGEIKGKFKEITTIYTSNRLPVVKVMLVGLGKRVELNADKIRISLAETCQHLSRKGVETIDYLAPEAGIDGLNDIGLSQCVAEGALLGSYTFQRHITRVAENSEIKQLNFLEPDESRASSFKEGCARGKIFSEATIYARDMVNEPANYLTPLAMAESATKLGIKYGLEIKILQKDEIHSLGMGGLMGVSQGSVESPKFIIINYKGKSSDAIDLALVGKGITFDSGGISIKPSESMGDMKGDMAGGASVMGAISAVAQLKPAVNVTALIPATENLPSGSAMKPGDIITISNGKTVEIISTDAEGRLILADGLSYACKIGAKRIIDVATLTGACHVALGDINTGAFSNNQDLIDRVIEAGRLAGERIWQMPVDEEYKEQNKTDIADIKNTGGRYGGAITAALFLEEFVDNRPWVHLDIAGTSMIEKGRGYQIRGATGVPVRTLINLILSLAE